MQVGVDDLHLFIRNDVARRHLAGTVSVHRHDLLLLRIEFGRQVLQIQDNLGYVLFHTGDGGKLVQHAFDSYAGDRHAGQ